MNAAKPGCARRSLTSGLNVSLRPFRPEDQAAVRALILAGLEERWGTLDAKRNRDLDDIAATYAAATILVAVSDSTLSDEVVGTGTLVRRSPQTAEIVRMSVDVRLRHRGIGRRILAALVAAARGQGYRCVVLETTATWCDAIAFYQQPLTYVHAGETYTAAFQITHQAQGNVYFALAL